MKARFPNARIRKQPGIRIPKPASSAKSQARSASFPGVSLLTFGFPYSDFFRISNFGIRILPAVLWVIGVPSSLAATNSSSLDEIPPLRPPRGEIPPGFREQYGWWVIAGWVVLLVLLGGVFWLVTRPGPPVIVPPDIAARRALESLRQQPEDGAVLSRVSQVLRHYLTTVFGLAPGETTTTEFCKLIAGNAQIGAELSAAIGDFLRQSDERKFAPGAPHPKLDAASQALKFIDLAEASRAPEDAKKQGASLP